MTGRFDRQIASAKRAIEKNGQLVIWRRVSDGAPANHDEPWKVGDATYEDKNVSIAFIPTNLLGREFLTYLRGSEVPTGAEVGLMCAVDFEPTLKDVVVRNGAVMRLNSIDPLAPNGQVILYTLDFVA